jgi:membrane associated rhomboid family serine protease
MFLPLRDQIDLKFIRRPYVTHALIAANLVIWLITAFMPNRQFNAIETAFGFIPTSSVIPAPEPGSSHAMSIAWKTHL